MRTILTTSNNSTAGCPRGVTSRDFRCFFAWQSQKTRLNTLLLGICFLLASPVLVHASEPSEGVLEYPDYVIELTSSVEPGNSPPPPATTGDQLHGLNEATGQLLECVTDPDQPWCPAVTVATSGGVFGVDLKLFYTTPRGLGALSTAYTSPPGCDHLGCATPTAGDKKDAFDSGYLVPGDHSESFSIGPTRGMDLTDIAVDNNPDAELQWLALECPRTFEFSMKESLPVFDGPFNRRRDVYRPPFGRLSGLRGAISIHGNEDDLVASGNDGVALARIRMRGIPIEEQTTWWFACPIFGSVFDAGLAGSTPNTAYHWTIAETGLGSIPWRDTVTPGSNYCGLPNYTSGYAGALCVDSEGVNGGFDTTATTGGSIDLSGLLGANLRFRINFQRRFEELVSVEASRDMGANWETIITIDESKGLFKDFGGEVVEVSLASFVGEPDIRLRFRYWDPTATVANDGYYAQIDDVLIHGFDEYLFIFADGFESGDTLGWSSTSP